MPAIVITGFEPFGGDVENPSKEIAKRLDSRRLGEHLVRSAVLPVQHEAAREMVDRLLADPDVRVVLHLGLAAGRARISLEQVAVNVMDYSIPDARGERPQGEPCVAGGPPAYFSTLPLRPMLAELTAEGIPACISYTAGTYLCNQTLYWTLHGIARRSLPVRAGFIHVPLLPSMVAAHGLEEASMDLALMIRAVEASLRAIAR